MDFARNVASICVIGFFWEQVMCRQFNDDRVVVNVDKKESTTRVQRRGHRVSWKKDPDFFFKWQNLFSWISFFDWLLFLVSLMMFWRTSILPSLNLCLFLHVQSSKDRSITSQWREKSRLETRGHSRLMQRKQETVNREIIAVLIRLTFSLLDTWFLVPLVLIMNLFEVTSV